MRTELSVLLPENQMIKMTRLGQKLMPLLAIISVSLPIATHSTEMVPSALAMALLMLSLPVQGLYWLGKRSQTSLPPALVTWYKAIHQTLSENEHQSIPKKVAPTFSDLASILAQAYSQLDKFAAS